MSPQPKPIRNYNSKAVFAELKKEFGDSDLWHYYEERNELGMKTYGKILETFNGRDCLVDALEEALDLSVYLMQYYMEQKADHEEEDHSKNHAMFLRSVALVYELRGMIREREAKRKSLA